MNRAISFTLHRWPGLPGLAWATGLLAALGMHGLLPVVTRSPASVWLAWLLGLTLVMYWALYCRASVTPWSISLLSSGLRKQWRTVPLTQVRMDGQWLLPLHQVATSPQLEIGVAEEFDTGEPYVYAQVDHQELELTFSVAQYAALKIALLQAAARRQLPDNDSQLTTDLTTAADA